MKFLIINYYSLQINCRTWIKDTSELIDYDSYDLLTKNLDINDSGYITRSTENNIIFSSEKNDNDLLLEVRKDSNSSYEIFTNACELDENKNIKSNNNCWFLFRKSIQGKNFKYQIKEGDIIRFGRVITRIKRIVIDKRFKNDIANKIKESNNDEDNNVRNEFMRKSGEFTNRKGNVSKVNSLKLSGDTKKINYLKLNIAKKENSKENENEMVLRVTQTIPIDFIQRSTKKTKLPKLCKICYGEEEDQENPLVQPCQCSGTLKYIHLNCLKHWLNTRSCIKLEGNDRFISFLVKQIECEICKAKYPDYLKHKDNIYEILELNTDFERYCIFEVRTTDKDGKRYIYAINLDKNTKLKIGRGHESNLTLGDISVSRVHSIFIIENKKIFLEDNNSKFGTLCLVQNPSLKLIEDLPLHIQVGRTYLDCKIKRAFSFFLCCNVSEKPDLNYYFHQNEEQKQPDLLKMFTIKTENDLSDYEINEKDKINYEEEKNKEIVNEAKTFYENEFYNNDNNNINNRMKIQFSKEDTFIEHKKTLNNEEEKRIENKDNNGDNDEKEKAKEVESIVLESESDKSDS